MGQTIDWNRNANSTQDKTCPCCGLRQGLGDTATCEAYVKAVAERTGEQPKDIDLSGTLLAEFSRPGEWRATFACSCVEDRSLMIFVVRDDQSHSDEWLSFLEEVGSVIRGFPREAIVQAAQKSLQHLREGEFFGPTIYLPNQVRVPAEKYSGTVSVGMRQ
jgi:hypothetical protein